MPQSLVNLNVHIVFSTKHRQPLIHRDLAPRLYGYIGGIVATTRSVLLAAGGTPDHIHVLVSLGKQTAIADLVRLVKCNSTNWVHETFADQQAFRWQEGYGAFTVSKSLIERVREYIANQEQHHAVPSFQDEFRDSVEESRDRMGRTVRLGLIL